MISEYTQHGIFHIMSEVCHMLQPWTTKGEAALRNMYKIPSDISAWAKAAIDFQRRIFALLDLWYPSHGEPRHQQ